MEQGVAAIESAAPAQTWSSTAWSLVELTRPRVMVLVLLTAPVVFFVEPAPIGTAVAVLAATAALAGGCSALNAWWERESDKRMERTRTRPLPTGRLDANLALGFGLGLSVVSIAGLAVAGGALCALVGLATLVHYVGVYTIWLKHRSAWNMVVGGASGAAAPLVADAVDGSFSAFAIVLFALVFFWQPPHFWAIGLFRKEEYASAGIPMLPSVIGDQPTRWLSLAHALLLLPLGIAPTILGVAGWPTAAAATLSAAFLTWKLVAALRTPSVTADRRVFFATLIYLNALFVVMLADVGVRVFLR